MAGQEVALQRIQTQVLKGQPLDVAYRFTIGVNGIAITAPYGKLAEMERVPGVKAVYLEQQYELDHTVQPDTSTSGEMIGSYTAWADGYTGAGSRVAIIDTGIDRDHPSFTGEGLAYGLAISAAKFGVPGVRLQFADGGGCGSGSAPAPRGGAPGGGHRPGAVYQPEDSIWF